MSVIRRRRMGQLPDAFAEASPARGKPIRRKIPDDAEGIQFEIDRMVKYVRDFRNHPLVVTTARRIVELCKPKDKQCEMNTLFLWTKGNFRYVNDPVNAETIATPVHQIAQLSMPPEILEMILGPELIKQMEGFGVGEAILQPPNQIRCDSCFENSLAGPRPKVSGDCDEAGTFLATMLAAIGIVPRFRVGGQNGRDGSCNFHHIWVQAADEANRWIDMDITETSSEMGWYFSGFQCYGHIPIF